MTGYEVIIVDKKIKWTRNNGIYYVNKFHLLDFLIKYMEQKDETT